MSYQKNLSNPDRPARVDASYLLLFVELPARRVLGKVFHFDERTTYNQSVLFDPVQNWLFSVENKEKRLTLWLAVLPVVQIER